MRRRVALKVIKLGMDTKSVIARFEAERQALALMDHPNIAKVLDAGATETGRPYFVMELVRGIKITEYCDEAQTLHARAARSVHPGLPGHPARAPEGHHSPRPQTLEHPRHRQRRRARAQGDRLRHRQGHQRPAAHRQDALHRLRAIHRHARLHESRAGGDDQPGHRHAQRHLRLGVLLYELLTGKTPFDAKELLAIGLDEMRRTIREQEPPRPSTRLSTLPGQELSTTAQRRGLDAPKLVSELRGDLDWIVMKALEKDRARRYETANGLAATFSGT